MNLMLDARIQVVPTRNISIFSLSQKNLSNSCIAVLPYSFIDNMSCLGATGDRKCPTHPSLRLAKMCVNKTCLEPLCQLCVQEHLAIHAQINTAADIRVLKDVGESYLHKLQNRERMLEDSYNRSMASSMVKGYVDDYFRKLRVDDRMMVSQKGNVANKNISGLLDVMVQDNKAELAPDFKQRLHQFLSRSLLGQRAEQRTNQSNIARGNVGQPLLVTSSLPENYNGGPLQGTQQQFMRSYPPSSSSIGHSGGGYQSFIAGNAQSNILQRRLP